MLVTQTFSQYKTNLLQYAVEVLHLLSMFLPLCKSERPYQITRQQFEQALQRFIHNSHSQGYPDEQIELAYYALVALIDECVLLSTWQYKQQWLNQPLQLQQFAENQAGEAFFHKLTVLCQQTKHYQEVIEIYYLCLLLGFKGKYLLTDSTALRHLQQNLHDVLTIPNLQHQPLLSVSEQTSSKQKIILMKRYYYGVVSAILLLLSGIYVICTVNINHQASDIIASLQAQQQLIKK